MPTVIEVQPEDKLTVRSPIVADRPSDESVQECITAGKPCIKETQIGYRILHTQDRGKVLPEPIVVGFSTSFFNNDELLSKYRTDGKYAVMIPTYGCGHDHFNWDEFWR